MKALLRLIVVFLIGVIVGYVLTPTIDGWVKTKVKSETVDTIKDKANVKADSLLNK